ncbi:hypothetical protein UFOVP431_67 [uncultured Caudovirales phage]|uniref:Uncharacterized protein n=1 Tax=uncultured Caudovirales phage TaxID=2100421 RepID=A0A6J5MSR5_9CAUD|nr:hypothetical protein UFOVP431_67 [uncultured Caudovirales phage]
MGDIPTMTAEAVALLTDIAKIRHTILEKAPQCLPLLAPTLVSAEQRIRIICGH